MTKLRSAALLSLLASTSPLAAQTLLSDRPGMWISVEPAASDVAPAADTAPQILAAPEAAPLIIAAPSGGQGVLLEHPSIASPNPLSPEAPSTRPRPRPSELRAPVAIAEDVEAPVVPDVIPEPELTVVIVASATDPRPVRRPREMVEATETELNETILAALDAADAPALPELEPEDEQVALLEPVEAPTPLPIAEGSHVADAAALAAELAALLAGDAREIMATAPLTPADDEDVAATEIAVASAPTVEEPAPTPRLAPTPTAFLTVAAMSSRNQPAALSAVLLPSVPSSSRPTVQPAIFVMPHEDAAPVLSRPLPEGPEPQVAIHAPLAHQPIGLSAVLVPSVAGMPDRAGRLRFASQPMPDMFPYSALPPEILPGGPDSQGRAIQPPIPAPEAMAAVLLTDPRPAPAPLSPLQMPDLPSVGTPPLDPDAAPELPMPDYAALARMISDAEICWRFADLSAEASWASLSVEVALDETNMPTTQSIRLTGFGRVMSSAAEEAFHAARGALTACAEATSAEPATAAATLTFDRNGVRLR